MKATIVALYLIGAIGTTISNIGWTFGSLDHMNPHCHWQRHASFAVAWSVITGMMWPVFLPAGYVINEFGLYGWQWPHDNPEQCAKGRE